MGQLRIMSHTVWKNDKNLPALQSLFTPDGWAWNIKNPKVTELFKNIRLELYDLFEEDEYFHIGFDEAYYYAQDSKLGSLLPDFLKI